MMRLGMKLVQKLIEMLQLVHMGMLILVMLILL